MIASYDAARDEMFGLIYGKMRDAAAAIVGYVPEIRWPGKPEPAVPSRDKFWCRASLNLISDRQASLANNQGSRRYEAVGMLYLQIFCPRYVANALENGILLGQTIRDTFKTESPSGIWFLNARVSEAPTSPESYQVQVAVEWRYETVSSFA